MTLMFHGSPYGGLKSFDDIRRLPVFFTEEERVAREYALTKGIPGAQKNPGSQHHKPTIYQVEIKNVHPFDMRKDEHKKLYVKLRSELSHDDDLRSELPKINAEGFLMSHTSLPGFGFVRLIWSLLKSASSDKFDSIWVDEGSQGMSLAIFEVKGKTRIVSSSNVGHVPSMAEVFSI